MSSKIIIFSDGAARGNPGPAGAGAVLSDPSGAVVAEISEYLGEKLTNNQAEYRALLLALSLALKKGVRRVKVYADSELMVKQIRGEYRVKNEGIKPLFGEAVALLRQMSEYTIEYLPREKNKRADELANAAIDGQRKTIVL